MDRQDYAIDEAARLLGLSVTTVRRQIKAGKIQARRVKGPHGWEYRISLDQTHETRVESTHGAMLTFEDSRASPQDSQVSPEDRPTMASLVTLASQLATRNEQLQTERAELYGRLGYLQRELEEAREKIRLLEAPKERTRPWWKLW